MSGRGLVGIAVALLALPAFGAVEGPGVNQYLRAARTSEPIRVDGKLDEAAWQQAPVFSDFVQEYPNEKAAPTERTDVRVLYDDRNVYFGFYLHDSHPELISRKLGRRDNPPTSDAVQILIDSAHDHRTGYLFKVTAGGVLADALGFQDSNFTDEWDAVWDGAATVVSDGWTAEIVVPLQILRFPAAPVQTWGFAVQRSIARLHEEDLSVYVPLNASGKISRLGHLTGLENLQPRTDFELAPYVGARAVLRPQFSDPANPLPRFWDPSADVGLDVKAALTSELTLNATVNPDFGQVEADQLILNLSTFEQYFPEKRPFFTQGMDIFQSIGGQDAPHQLFYSRRIGLDTPILGAAKVTGSLGKGIDIGLLDAVVAGPWASNEDESRPDRRFQLYLTRPLHYGLNDELPTEPAVPRNFLVGVARAALGGSSTVSARFASAVPLTGTCTDAEAALDSPPPSCVRHGANTGGVDWDLRTSDGLWALRGQAEGSQVVGGPPSETLRDGTVLRRGDLGYGGFITGGKVGGEPLRFDLSYRYASPTLELNATGFLKAQNRQSAVAGVYYVRPSGMGLFKRFEVDLSGSMNWTTDGRALPIGVDGNVWISATLPNWYELSFSAGFEDPQNDIREISGTGVAFRRLPQRYISFYWNSDASQPFVLNGNGAIGFHDTRDGLRIGNAANLYMTWRPNDWLETRLTLSEDDTPHGPRWVDQGDPDQFFFADLRSQYLSVTLRQQWVLTPRLTLQAYAQLFTDYGRFGPFYEARGTPGMILRIPELGPSSYASDPSFHDSALNVNVVLRWEYRLGSTIYLVYTHAQHEGPYPAGTTPPATLWPGHLFSGPATDAFLVKWSYWWNV